MKSANTWVKVPEILNAENSPDNEVFLIFLHRNKILSNTEFSFNTENFHPRKQLSHFTNLEWMALKMTFFCFSWVKEKKSLLLVATHNMDQKPE